MNLIDKIPNSHYKSLQYRNELLWKSYEQLNGFLNKNFDSELHNVLAKPFASGSTINWHSVQSGEFKPLDSFSLAQKQSILLSYHTILSKISEKNQFLRDSGNADNVIWADMLSLAFNEKNNIVYTDGKELVILWGFDFNNGEENYIDPVLLASHLQSLSSLQGSMSDSLQDENGGNEVHDTLDTGPEFQYQRTDYDGKKIIVRSNKKEQRKDRFLNQFWWILLFIPLLLLFLYLHLNNSHSILSSSSSTGNLKNILPQDPLKRPPLDTSKIIKGDSGISKIISNVFNIALKDKTKNLGTFAEELKKAFPDSGYKIVFFDTSTLRLQFQFPDSDRTELKSKIRSKMDDYDLLIWDESIFSTSKTFNDPSFSDPEQSWYLQAVGAPLAWDLTSGNADIVIAVIDDGFDLANADLSSKIVKPFNTATRTSTVNADDVRFHGTHVAGIALGKANNGIGISGIAPDCSFMPVQVTDNAQMFTSSDVIDGILYAIKNGADVINLSLGKYFPEEVTDLSIAQQEALSKTIAKDEEEFWNDLFDYAEKEHTIIVIASGNQHVLVGLDPMQRSSKTIKVSAVNSRLEAAAFSNFGSNTTIYAPGERIYGLVPNGKQKFMDGTSMAAPIVSGAIALMKSRKKDLSLDQILGILKKNSDPIKIVGGGIFLRVDKLVKAVS